MKPSAPSVPTAEQSFSAIHLSHRLHRWAQGPRGDSTASWPRWPEPPGDRLSGLSDELLLRGLKAKPGGEGPGASKSVLQETAEPLAESNSTQQISTEPGLKLKSLLLFQVKSPLPNQTHHFWGNRRSCSPAQFHQPQQPSFPPWILGVVNHQVSSCHKVKWTHTA